MRITADRRDQIRADFAKSKITVEFLPNNGSPKMYGNPKTRTVVFNLHAIEDNRELSQLISQAKGQMGVK